MPTASAASPFVHALLIFVSVALVAGITYVYTNRNKSITFIFTLLALATIALIYLVSIIDVRLHTHFIGGFTETRISYVAVAPGWAQLWHAWHIWLLPVVVVAILMGSLALAIWHYGQHHPPVQVLTPRAVTAEKKSSYFAPTNANRLNSFMAINAAKKEAQLANEKLTEALLTNASYEIQISDLTAQIQELETRMQEMEENSAQEKNILQLELTAKQKENDYLIEQLAQRNKDLKRIQGILEDLLAEEEEEETKSRE